jgi:ABC-type bacteriocin/lantibiotic exporter with double-glycine peptidase domain
MVSITKTKMGIIFTLAKEFVKLHAAVVFTGVALSVLHHTIQTVVTPKLLARIFTSLDDKPALKTNVAYFLMAFSTDKVSEMLAGAFNIRVEPLLTSFLLSRFVDAMMLQYRATHKPLEVGFTIDKIYSVRTCLEEILYFCFSALVPLVISMTIAIVSVYFINLYLGMLVTVAIISIVGLLLLLPRAPSSMVYKERVTMLVEDLFQNIEYVTTAPFGNEHIRRHIKRHVDELRTARLRSQGATSRNQMVAYSISIIFYIATVCYLVRLFNRGDIETKEFESSILSIGRLYELTYSLAYLFPDVSMYLTNIKHMTPYLERLFSYKERPGEGPAAVPDGRIDFENVTFAYGEDGAPVLWNFDLHIPSGQLTALYGRSGSGKSSFTKLVMDIDGPQQGRVLIGGVPVQSLSSSAVSHVVSSMPQSASSLMKMTVYENIVFGVTPGGYEPSLRRDVDRLVAEYNLASIFGDDPMFLDRMVDKSGSSLSGGQKQIIFLLHAVLNEQAKVLVVDEPTSALDGDTRDTVIRMLHELKKSNKTVLVITHDPEVRDVCERALEFSPGQNPKWKIKHD